MGGTITVTLTPAATTFKHKLKYSFGNLSNQTEGLSCGSDFTAAGNTTVTFKPPVTLANQIPSSTSGNCTLYCYTYNSDGVQIGETTKTILLTVPDYTLTVNVTLEGKDLLGGDYVSGKSKVKVTVTATSLYGATATNFATVVDGKTYAGIMFNSNVLTAGSKTIKTTVKDSRGKSVTVNSGPITVYDYSVPAITAFTFERQSDGTTVIATLKGSVASVNGKNAKSFQVTLNGVTKTITSSSYTLNGTTTFTNVPTDNTFTGTAKITDSYTSVTKEAVLPTVAVTLDFHNSGKGVAFGKVAETSDLLEVAWDAAFKKNLTVDGKLIVGGKELEEITPVKGVDYFTDEDIAEIVSLVLAQISRYEGSYSVTPAVEEQTLETKEKLMTDNVTIQEIPYYDTSNNAGGTTAYIGGSLDE